MVHLITLPLIHAPRFGMVALNFFSWGKCKLGWFKSDKNRNPKSPYKVHILTLKWEKMLKTNVEWALSGN
jgi:hypothetical protein